MDKVRVVTGRALPLDRANVDTDQIIPSEWLKRVERTGYEDGLFAEWREDPKFVLNLPEYARAVILVTGDGFGIGSSREHAVWALVDYGFRAVISPRIADIFKENSTRSGLVPAEVTPEVGRRLLDAVMRDPALEVTVDVDQRLVRAPAAGITAPFSIDDSARERLLGGLDDVELTLTHAAELEAFEERRAVWLPHVSA